MNTEQTTAASEQALDAAQREAFEIVDVPPIPQILRNNVFVVVDVSTGTSVFLATEAAAREIVAYDHKRYFYTERPVLADSDTFLRQLVEQEKKRVQMSVLQKLDASERKALNLGF